MAAPEVRAVLLNPPFMVHPRNIASGIVIPPLWAATLAASAQQAGFNVTVVDALGLGLGQKWLHASGWFRGLTMEQILDLLSDGQTVLGISCPFSNAWPMARDLAWGIREQFPETLIVMGGEHASAMPELTLLEGPADLVVMGEGEGAWIEVLNQVQKARQREESLRRMQWSGVKGVVWRDINSAARRESPRPRITDLDALPPPHWNGVPLATYFKQRSGHGADVGPFMPLLASRGCPYQCTFCASPNSWPGGWAARSPKVVVDEMANYITVYGVYDFHFTDLSLALKREWVQVFCQEIIQKKLRVTWQLPTGTRSEAIDRETARLMAQAGCTHVSFAVESGDAAMLREVKKKLDLGRQLESARYLMKAGVHLFGFFIIGFPNETWRSLWGTYIALLKTAWSGFGEVNISVFCPVPGSNDFQRLQAQGLKVDDDFFTDVFNWATLGKQKSYCRFSALTLRMLTVFFLASFFMLSWTLRPWRPFRELFGILSTGTAGTKMTRVLRSFQDIRKLRVVPTRLKGRIMESPPV